MEGLHVVGGVIPVEKISIIHAFNFMLCMLVILVSFHVFHCMYELLLVLFQFVW
jgi:hypothetical protein